MNLHKITFPIFALIVFLLSISIKSWGEDVPLNAYLNKVLESSEDIRAIDLDIQSLQLEIQARDLELTPVLGVELTHFWDDRPSSSTNPELEGDAVNLSLSKPFATGTSLTLLSDMERTDYLTRTDEDNLLNWELDIRQSLWQNSFGHQTRLRRQRDQYELQSRLIDLMIERQQTLVDFESLYWDIAYAQQEVDIRTKNLDRSREIYNWFKDRFDRSAAEHVDLLQAQTLVATRELQLQVASDNLKTLQSRLKEKLLITADLFPEQQNLREERDYLSLPVELNFAPATPILLATLKEQADADYLKANSELEADKIKPIFDVRYAYGQQGLNTSFSQARRDAFSTTDNHYHEVGVIFSIPLDVPLILKSNRAFKYQAEAQKFRSDRAQRQSQLQWADLERMIADQKQRVQTAATLADLQKQKSDEERTRLEKGKTTAFQAISFEQEASESELLVLQLMNQLRKTEAQARIYSQKTVTQ